jgi:hypothetical protein
LTYPLRTTCGRYSVADGERHHRRADRDAPQAFRRERVGLGVAVVDAAHVVDDARGVQQSFGQAGLSRVSMGEDPEVHGFRHTRPLISGSA